MTVLEQILFSTGFPEESGTERAPICPPLLTGVEVSVVCIVLHLDELTLCNLSSVLGSRLLLELLAYSKFQPMCSKKDSPNIEEIQVSTVLDPIDI